MDKKWTWWEPPPMRLAYRIYDFRGRLIAVGPVLGSHEVFCDICNSWVTVRPVPVFSETYALCSDCFQSLFGLPLQEAAKQDGVQLSEIDPFDE